jgi:DNA ligase-1
MTHTPFASLADTFERLEHTSAGTAMINALADFFSRVSPEEARMAAYLLRGRVAPDYERTELGVAEKLVVRCLAAASHISPAKVEAAFRKAGDLGDAAAALRGNERGTGLSLRDVFERLMEIAQTVGAGAQETKIRLLEDLLQCCSRREAKYIVRIVLGKLRLGVGEMTFLAALSQAITGSKAGKPILDNAYNLLSDLGEVAERAVRSGVESLRRVRPLVGKPIRMMLVQRIRNLAEVPAHLHGPLYVEYKYDGERVQAHLGKDGVVLFSRRLEDITHQFPDVARAVRAAFRGKEAIVEGEAVAINPKSGKLRDFQTLMQRRRKYHVEEYRREIPVKYFVFDVLYVNDESLLNEPLSQRKAVLARRLKEGKAIAAAKHIVTEDQQKIEHFFTEAVGWGAEGVVIKDTGSHYEPGKRGWHWVKYKKEYRAGLADTFDLVVVGAMYGRGARAGTYGSLLLAAFDPETNKFCSLTKVGTGLTDAELKRLPRKLTPYRRNEKHRLVETGVKADVWFDPAVVVEVTGAQLTVSPVHTVARRKIRAGGLALRFPRFLHWRADKAAEQATTVQEIYDLYRRIQKQ